MILLLILTNAVVLFIQAARSITLPEDGSGEAPHVQGYFHGWEDYVLFVLFCLFT